MLDLPVDPRTPQKKPLVVVEAVIRKLNDDYALGIGPTDRSLTPARRRQLCDQDERYARWDRIWRGIHILSCRRDGTLDQALVSFFNEAKALSLSWVPKPRADPGTIPSSSSIPKAQTQGQQYQLQTLILKVFDSYRSPIKLLIPPPASARSNGSGTGPAQLSASSPDSDYHSFPDSPASAGSKRSYDSDFDQSAKRFRGREVTRSPCPSPTPRLNLASALDNVPSRQRTTIRPADWSPERRRQEIPGRQPPLNWSPVHPQNGATPRRPPFDWASEAQNLNGAARQLSPPPNRLPEQQHQNNSRQQPGGPPKWPSGCRRLVVDRSDSGSTDSSGSTSVPSIFSENWCRSTQTSFGSESEPKRAPAGVPTHPSSSDHAQTSQIVSLASRSAYQPAALLGPPVPAHPPQSSNASVYFKFPDVDFPNSATQRLLFDRIDRAGASFNGELTPLQQRLQNILPKFPRWLHGAPLAIAWEITRICRHCNVDLEYLGLKYNPKWATSGMDGIWRDLNQLEVFRGKSFPERPAAEVFAAALTTFETRGNSVVMSAALEFNPDNTGPLFLLDMKPLRFDEGCRLTRRFGPDRFMEILVPSPNGLNAPTLVKEGGAEEIIKWLTQPHSLVGRQWQAFYSKDAGYRKPAKELRLGPDAKPSFKERVHFFAESGHNFRSATIRSRCDIPQDDTVQRRTSVSAGMMLDWLLQLEQNEGQPHLKLFSRIQLGLSKTQPTVVFEPDQIRHHSVDILSPIGKVMNDGVARMSRSVARKIRDSLGLSDIPSAIQGRMGSAKGMWLMDVADGGDEDWIETYPSQRKWECDQTDPLHRTLEVRSVSSELKPAGLNLQFLPVLEDRAREKVRMRRAIAARLENDLEKQFKSQKTALKNPLLFRQWVNESANGRSDRVRHGQVPFLGGLPENKGEILHFLLNSGFDRKQKYVQELAWELQKQRCDILRTKLNIKVGRSAYIYMVVDFWGVLEENEVHIGFSSKFRDDSDDVSYTLLADCDVLVARSPAHFVSDVQKVRAVFKAELHALKDVIVFPAKGNIALADKLSGGDYDGDLAWVCWDPDIVSNFVNADIPLEPDLSSYLGKDKTTFKELVHRTSDTGQPAHYAAVYDMIEKGFNFAMQPNYLGICTNYKERLCYHNNSVNNRAAITLSSLVGKLVDQSKQGIIFDSASWDRLRRELFGGKMHFEDPAYKGDVWGSSREPCHIIDHLKFAVAKPTIDRQLEALHKAMQASKSGDATPDEDTAYSWDKDLAVCYAHFETTAQNSRSFKDILTALKNAIAVVEREWKIQMNKSNRDPTANQPYPEKVRQLHAKWLAIEPRAIIRTGSNRLDYKTAALLEQPYLSERGAGAAATSNWALLKASTAFKIYFKQNPKFVWQMAGMQLAFIKAQMSSSGPGREQMPLLVTPLMYAGLMPDGRFVKQYMARLEGEGSEYHDLEEAQMV
ncbi:hypothetical protein N0V88_006828 [Collariella sp. IMI 366227]|nr:hypothetical protein N0V88_006828 [Collariella sp. IMI 366227]